MMGYDNTNTGLLFKNDKQGHDNWPDYQGKIDVDGTEYWLSAWIKDGKNGKYMSLAVKAKSDSARSSRDAKPEPQPQQSRRSEATGDFEDDIPFIVNECMVETGSKFERRMRRARR
jgi:hypothetical protein